MTVSARTTKTTQNCNGSLTDFDFSFAIYKEEDIAVILKHVETETETLLALNTDYTIASDDFADGGTVSTIKEIDAEMVAYAWSADYSITIMLSLGLVQETDLLYGGSFSSEAIELTVDRLTRIAQQLDEKINRTLKLRKTSALNNIEIDDLEAGKFVIVNAAGDALEMGTIAGEVGQSPISNNPYDKTGWASIVDIAPSKNAIRDELVNNRLTKGSTYAMILALNSGDFGTLPISNNAYGASWENQFNITPSQNALFDKLETIGTGSGDVHGPATNTIEYVPQWLSPDSKTLKNGFPITAFGKTLMANINAAAVRSTLSLASAALRAAEDALTDGANLPDGHAIKTYGDANWGDGAGNVVGPGSSVDNAIPLFNGVTGELLQDSARLIEDALTDGANLPDGHAIKTYGDANWGDGKANLTDFLEQTAWRLFYSDAAGDVTELALGTLGQYLKANGVDAAPTWAVPDGAGDVVGPATHAASYVPQWNETPNSKTLIDGFAITAAGKAILDDVNAAAQRETLELASAALRAAEDALTDGANLPDGHAIKTYGDANWGSGAGDVVGPATHAASYVPQWNETPNSKTLIDGFLITTLGKSLLNDVTAAAMRSTLNLSTAATRAAEDALTDGANLPDGHAIVTYGNANWGGGSSKWTDAGQFIYPGAGSGYRILDAGTNLNTISLASNTVYILAPGATYDINANLTITGSFISIIGYGATIRKTGTSEIYVSGSHNKLIGFEIDGNSQNYSNIDIRGAYNEVNGVTSHHSSGTGIVLWGSSARFNLVTNCVSYSNAGMGIGSWLARYNTISNNVAYSNSQDGFTCDGTPTYPAYGNIYVGNQSYNNSCGIGIDSAHNCTFVGNHCFSNSPYGGITTWNIGGPSSHLTLSGNVLNNNNLYGITIVSGAGGASTYCKLVGNIYNGNGSGDYYICGACSNCEVIETAGGGGGLGNIVEDVTPQLGGDLDCNYHNIGLTNNMGLFGKNTSGVDKEIVRLNNYNNIMIGEGGTAVILGTNCSYDNPVAIRVGGTNQNWIQKSVDTDSQGKYYLVIA